MESELLSANSRREEALRGLSLSSVSSVSSLEDRLSGPRPLDEASIESFWDGANDGEDDRGRS